MHLKILKYFLICAEEMHVGRAAEKIGIAQPALSQHIKALEQRLGVRLFKRAHRKIELTEAGAVFLVEAGKIIDATQKAFRLTQDAERGLAGELHVGYSGSVIFDPKLRKLLKRFLGTYPQVSMAMHENAPADSMESLRAGKIDVALMRGPIAVQRPDLEVYPFSRSRLVLCLPADHPLVDHPDIDVSDLRSGPWISFLDPPGYGIGECLSQLCARAGFSPNIALHSGSMVSILGLVGAGFGVGIIPDLPLQFSSTAFVLKPIRDPQAWTEVLLVTRKQGGTKVQARFVEMANAIEPG